jgi:hypothetical protein
MDTFAGPVMFTPVKSQPGKPAYSARGIFGTEPIDVLAEDSSIVSDQRTILDIREAEFTVLPVQGDHVFLAANDFADQIMEDTNFEILDADTNGGGETTLSLRKLATTPSGIPR